MKRTMQSRTRRLVGVVAALSMAIVVYGVPARAATGPSLVKDINPGFEDSTPRWLTEMNGTLYFGAKGPKGGRELWRSDGTSGSTNRVRDIRPGARGSDPMDLTFVGGLLYFSANDGVNGRELWVSDGTGAGTRLVSDIHPGSAGSDPRDFTSFKGRIYFSADDGSTGRELWRTDGTVLGTRLVKDLVLGPEGSSPETLVLVAGKLFFLGACDPTTSCSHFGISTLYRTDGSAAGTRAFRNHDGQIITGWIWGLNAAAGRLYFDLGTPEQGATDGLWRSNGTAATTRKIADLRMNSVTEVGGTAFIAAGQLWKSDGTAATTVLVKDVSVRSWLLFTAVGNELFFNAEYGDWWHTLWTSDGTTDGTQPHKSVYPLSGESASIGSILYFGALEDDYYTLWRSDGTASGTHSVGGTEASMWDITAVGNSIYWVSDAADHGNELWRYVP